MRVRLLAGFEVEGVAARDLGSRKARTLLKVLATARGRPVPVDRIADALWGEAPPARPGDQVGVLVSRLRGALGAERLVRGDGGYSLVADWYDLDEVERLVAAAADALGDGRIVAARVAADAALGLARGPLLPDEDGDWVEAERAAADATVRHLRRLAVDAAVAAGDDDGAAAAAEGALAADPYDEAVLRALMSAHLRAGRPASALAAYARVRERLAEDLGVPPTAETESLHGVALAAADGDAVAAVAVRDGAAARPEGAPTAIVGRDTELGALDAAFRRVAGGATELVLVEGEPGIGKTALVDEWARGLRGVTVLRGRCDELGRDLPLQPVADAVVEHLKAVGGDAAAGLAGADAAVLAPLLGPAGGSPATTVGDAEAARLQVYGALVAVVGRAGGGAPTVLVIDDLQHAGASTLAWLAFAARRCERTLIVAATRVPGPAVPATVRLALGPLDRDAVAALVGDEASGDLYARSGGHPLLLTALRSSTADAAATLADVVGAAVDSLGGDVAPTVRAAAALGVECDLELVANVCDAPVTVVLAHLEAAARAAVLTERGSRFVFRHALVREALEAGTGEARRALLHRRAAQALAARPDPDPLAVAVHAAAGGDVDLARRSFVAAAGVAAARFDLDTAEEHLAAALELGPAADVYTARARVRVGRLSLDDAQADAERAIALGGGAPAAEVAGWVAYYRRRYDDAGTYADEAAATASDDAVRVSASSLAGRVRHAAGDLVGAEAQLTIGDPAPPPVRGVADVWLAQLRAHQGRPHDALAALARPMVAPDALAHPFAPLHLRFNRVVALGQLGRVEEALRVCADLDDAVRREGRAGARFASVADNVAAWILRWSGRGDEADERNRRARDATGGAAGPSGDWFAEPHYVSMLDLADGCLLRGDAPGAAALADALAPLDSWNGTMAWHQRHRLGLLRARLALLDGERDVAAERARAVADDAGARGAGRYELLARAVVGVADPAVPDGALDEVVAGLARCAALDGWPIVDALGAARHVERWREEAARQAAAVVAASGAHAPDAQLLVSRVLDR